MLPAPANMVGSLGFASRKGTKMRLKVLLPCFAVAALALASTASVSASPAAPTITEWWQGSWDTSTGPLHMSQNGRKVTARYKSGPGCTGLVVAEAQGQVGQHLVGTFNDRCSGGDSGKLRATVDVDESPLTFRGRFCENVTRVGPCGRWITWKGKHR